MAATLTVAASASSVAEGRPAPPGGTAATPVPGGNAGRPPLCTDLAALTRVAATPVAGLHAAQPARVLPGGVTVRDRPLVQRLAAALCGLPKAPRGLVTCPAVLGGRLRLVFSAGWRRFAPVTVGASGCLVVAGLGPPRAPSSRMWGVLGDAVGFRLPLGTPGTPGAGGGLNG